MTITEGGQLSTSTSPLDLNIDVSEEEFSTGRLSRQNVQLGVMLLHMRGYVILRNAVPLSLVSDLRASFEPIYAEDAGRRDSDRASAPWLHEIDAGDSVYWERGSRFRIFPKLKGPFASQYVLRNPFADPIISETLGPDYYCKFVSSDTCVKGSTQQAPHRDIDFYDDKKTFGCIVNVPIMHCGLHNGPTEVWPCGSHLWRSEKFFQFDLQPFVQDGVNPQVEELARHIPSKLIELHPGELLIRDPGMWHRGTPNPTDEPRTMLTSGYFRQDYYYQYGDPFYNLDDTLYADLEPDVQQLFAPFFDRSDHRFRKLRQDQAIKRATDNAVLGAPVRAGLQAAVRFKRRARAMWSALS